MLPSYGPNIDKYWASVVDAFNQSNGSGITVKISTIDEETYKTKLPIDLRSSEPPDVFFQWEGGEMAFTVKNNYAANLDPYYQQYGWNDKINKGALSVSSLNGTKYLVCYNMTVYTFFYNKKVFEKNNISIPNTWEELMKAADTLKAAGVSPFVMGNKSKWEAQFPWTNLLIHKYGIDVWNQLAENKIPWTDERVVDAFTQLKKLVDDGYFYQGVNAIDYTDSAIPLMKGDAAIMMYMGSFMPKNFETPEDIGVFTWPAMDSTVGEIPQVFCESSFMIHANSAHPDAAAKFLDFVISAENQTKFMQAKGGIATNKEADYSILSPLVQEQLKIAEKVSTVSFMPVDHQFDPSISSEFLDALQTVLGGGMTPQEAAEAVEKAAVEFRGEVK